MKNTAIIRIVLSIVVFCCIAIRLPHAYCLGEPEAKNNSVSSDEKRLEDAMLAFSKDVCVMLEEEIEDNKKRRSSGRISAKLSTQQVQSLQAKLSLFRKQPYQVPKLHLTTLKVGDIGQLTGNMSAENDPEQNHFKVIQVIDASNMLIESIASFAPNEANVATKRDKKIAWVSGVSTSGVTDDSYVKLGQLFEVKGTKQYGTVIGSTNTVFHLALFPIQDTKQIIERRSKAVDVPLLIREGTGEGLKSKPRLWRDVTGKFSVMAKFGGVIDGKIILLTDDGRKLTIPVERMSEPDRKLLK
jgi:hypothetical protein